VVPSDRNTVPSVGSDMTVIVSRRIEYHVSLGAAIPIATVPLFSATLRLALPTVIVPNLIMSPKVQCWTVA
jgi:hypothetical protein